jgi:catalase (peroxidase I)
MSGTGVSVRRLASGLRALNASFGQSEHHVHRPARADHDFCVSLLDIDTEWKPSAPADGVCADSERNTGEQE